MDALNYTIFLKLIYLISWDFHPVTVIANVGCLEIPYVGRSGLTWPYKSGIGHQMIC